MNPAQYKKLHELSLQVRTTVAWKNAVTLEELERMGFATSEHVGLDMYSFEITEAGRAALKEYDENQTRP
jgi:hypothetical protein